MKNVRLTLGFLFCVFIITIPAGGVSESKNAEVPVEKALESNVEFWTQVYTAWSNDQGVIHDARNPEVLYEVFNLPGGWSKNKGQVIERMEKWRAVLLELHQSPELQKKPQTDDQKRVVSIFKDISEENSNRRPKKSGFNF